MAIINLDKVLTNNIKCLAFKISITDVPATPLVYEKG